MASKICIGDGGREKWEADTKAATQPFGHLIIPPAWARPNIEGPKIGESNVLIVCSPCCVCTKLPRHVETICIWLRVQDSPRVKALQNWTAMRLPKEWIAQSCRWYWCAAKSWLSFTSRKMDLLVGPTTTGLDLLNEFDLEQTNAKRCKRCCPNRRTGESAWGNEICLEISRWAVRGQHRIWLFRRQFARSSNHFGPFCWQPGGLGLWETNTGSGNSVGNSLAIQGNSDHFLAIRGYCRSPKLVKSSNSAHTQFPF